MAIIAMEFCQVSLDSPPAATCEPSVRHPAGTRHQSTPSRRVSTLAAIGEGTRRPLRPAREAGRSQTSSSHARSRGRAGDCVPNPKRQRIQSPSTRNPCHRVPCATRNVQFQHPYHPRSGCVASGSKAAPSARGTTSATPASAAAKSPSPRCDANHRKRRAPTHKRAIDTTRRAAQTPPDSLRAIVHREGCTKQPCHSSRSSWLLMSGENGYLGNKKGWRTIGARSPPI